MTGILGVLLRVIGIIILACDFIAIPDEIPWSIAQQLPSLATYCAFCSEVGLVQSLAVSTLTKDAVATTTFTPPLTSMLPVP